MILTNNAKRKAKKNDNELVEHNSRRAQNLKKKRKKKNKNEETNGVVRNKLPSCWEVLANNKDISSSPW